MKPHPDDIILARTALVIARDGKHPNPIAVACKLLRDECGWSLKQGVEVINAVLKEQGISQGAMR